MRICNFCNNSATVEVKSLDGKVEYYCFFCYNNKFGKGNDKDGADNRDGN